MQTDYIDIDTIAMSLIDTLRHGARLTLECRGDQVVAVVSHAETGKTSQTFAGSLVKVLDHTARWSESVTKEEAQP